MPGLTIKEVAAKLSCEEPTARALMTAMTELKLAEVSGKRERPDGKGKPSNEYTLADDAVTKFKDIVARLGA